MKPEVIFWDIDGTLLPSSMESLLVSLLRADRELPLHRLTLNLLCRLLTFPPPYWYNIKLFYLRNRTIEEVESLAYRCWEQKIRPRLRSRLTDTIRRLNDTGRRQVLLSGTPRFLAERVAKHVGLTEIIAAEPEVIDGKLSGGVTGPYPIGMQKLIEADSWLNANGFLPAQALALADHWNDRHLLRHLGKAIVVYPAARQRREAEMRGWPVIDSDTTLEELLRLIDD